MRNGKSLAGSMLVLVLLGFVGASAGCAALGGRPANAIPPAGPTGPAAGVDSGVAAPGDAAVAAPGAAPPAGPTGPAAGVDSGVVAPGDAAVAAPAGSLAVSMTMAAGATAYTTQARVADIDHIDVTVQATATGSIMATIASPSIAAGSASRTFAGLPPGPATVSAAVYSAASVLIGSGSATATVQSGQATAVSLAITLVPTIIQTGSLGANISISDGPVVYVTPAATSTASVQGFVAIDPGTFTMGSPADELGRSSNETQHQVTLTRGFYMQASEVTQGQWKALMGNNPSYFPNAGDAAPVESVNWWDAAKYANALSASESLPACYALSGCTGTAGSDLNCTGVTVTGAGGSPYACTGYRLPTEAEWEYAYRAGTTTAFYNGAITQTGYDPVDPKLDAIGWYWGNSDVTYSGGYSSSGRTLGTHPVGQKQANAWGLYDMSGNVWEWSWDWFGTYPGTTTDPLGPSTGSSRVLRGGSWNYGAQGARAAYRNGSTPGYRSTYLGFRLARSRP